MDPGRSRSSHRSLLPPPSSATIAPLLHAIRGGQQPPSHRHRRSPPSRPRGVTREATVGPPRRFMARDLPPRVCSGMKPQRHTKESLEALPKTDRAELRREITLDTQSAASRFSEFDVDGNKSLDFEEFLAMMPSRIASHHRPEDIRKWFDVRSPGDRTLRASARAGITPTALPPPPHFTSRHSRLHSSPLTPRVVAGGGHGWERGAEHQRVLRVVDQQRGDDPRLCHPRLRLREVRP